MRILICRLDKHFPAWSRRRYRSICVCVVPFLFQVRIDQTWQFYERIRNRSKGSCVFARLAKIHQETTTSSQRSEFQICLIDEVKRDDEPKSKNKRRRKRSKLWASSPSGFPYRRQFVLRWVRSTLFWRLRYSCSQISRTFQIHLARHLWSHPHIKISTTIPDSVDCVH